MLILFLVVVKSRHASVTFLFGCFSVCFIVSFIFLNYFEKLIGSALDPAMESISGLWVSGGLLLRGLN